MLMEHMSHQSVNIAEMKWNAINEWNKIVILYLNYLRIVN